MIPFNLGSVHKHSSLIEGYDVIRNAFPLVDKFTDRVITYYGAVLNSLDDVASDWSDWPEDQGFGSSDMTFVRKDFIDSMIGYAGLHGRYETKFAPYLKVVKYSEASHHQAVEKMESGI